MVVVVVVVAIVVVVLKGVLHPRTSVTSFIIQSLVGPLLGSI